VNLNPGVGAEQSGIRPALVISNDWFNITENYLVIVVPITGTDRSIHAHYRIPGREGGLSKRSVAMCDQVRTISPQRLLQRRGVVSAGTLEEVRWRAIESIRALPLDEPRHPDK
jgi:mRNA interferase MazF